MEYLALWMFVVLFLLIILGFPVAFALIGTALVFGFIRYEDIYVYQLIGRVETIAGNWVLAAVPLFVFMGALLERSGIAERLFDAFRLWTRNLPGGIAIAAILMCVLFAASSGVVGATEAVVGLLAIPAMLKYGYDRKLISGVICAGGSLGTIIPPSVVLIILGPMANVSIGQLFAAAMVPGFVLAGLYLCYVVLLALIAPSQLPRASADEPMPPLGEKLRITATALLPPLLLVTAVLGSILAGIASPTEAAAVGGAGALLLAIVDRSLTWRGFGQAIMQTLRVTTMIMFILMGGMMFTSVFFALQGMSLITGVVDALNLSPWMLLVSVLLMAFLLGFFLEWISILLIFIPIFTPLLMQMGFDPVWFCILFLLIIQTSYLTPPMAPAIFYLRGIAPKEITLRHMYLGMVPFLGIQVLMITLVAIFPAMALWLPGVIFG